MRDFENYDVKYNCTLYLCINYLKFVYVLWIILIFIKSFFSENKLTKLVSKNC